MRILNILTFTAAIALSITACNNKTRITGEVEGVDEIVLLEAKGRETDTVSTLAVKDGKFTKDLELDSVKLYYVSVTPRFIIPLFINPGDNVKIEVTDATGEKPNYTVSGSKESERVKEITDVVQNTIGKIDSLNQINQQIQGDSNYVAKKAELDSAYENIMADAAEKYKKMIDREPGSLANIFIFSQAIGRRPILNVRENLDYLEKINEGLVKNYPDHSITKNLTAQAAELKKSIAREKEMEETSKSIVAGAPVPEIELPGPDGNIKKLSALRGKVVLVDFWAAWCRPCRMENPNLVAMYNKYKDQGFTVYSVSLDGVPNQQNPQEAWQQAIEQDNLTWDNHVSDLRGWESSVVSKFGFQGIPYTVLVDRDGTIIEANLRGSALEEKLKEVL